MTDFAALRRLVRATVHETFSVPATYYHGDMSVPVDLSVRRFYEATDSGDFQGQYARRLGNLDRIAFSRAECEAKAAPLLRTGLLTFKDTDEVFRLDHQDPSDGSDIVMWSVTASNHGR